ncbi:hypothetical protein H8356DRAFT_1705244, partial [Neocallimastix lanati (nom. inval.)]
MSKIFLLSRTFFYSICIILFQLFQTFFFYKYYLIPAIPNFFFLNVKIKRIKIYIYFYKLY